MTDRLNQLEKILSDCVDKQAAFADELIDFRRESEKRWARIEANMDRFASNAVELQEAIKHTNKNLDALARRIDTYFENLQADNGDAKK